MINDTCKQRGLSLCIKTDQMQEFISNYDSLIQETYDTSFETFLKENFELIFDCLNQDFEYCELSLSSFKMRLIQLYNTEDELFFKYIAKSISARIGFEDFFQPIASYNYAFEDWKESNKGKDDLAFYSDVPYAFLSDVKVFGFRTKNTLCLFHLAADDYKFYKLYKIEDNNFKVQLSGLINSK